MSGRPDAMPSGDSKRKRRRGPGRPKLPAKQRAATTSLRLRPEDRQRLDRLRELWDLDSDTDTMRRALELADS